MTIDVSRAREMKSYVDASTGEVDRRIYTDQDIFQLEMEQIFASAWLFMCHD